MSDLTPERMEHFRRVGGAAAKRGQSLRSILGRGDEIDALITEGYERRKRRERKRDAHMASVQAGRKITNTPFIAT